MFNNAPIKVANMANFGEPSALIIPFNPVVIIEKDRAITVNGYTILVAAFPKYPTPFPIKI